MKRLEIRPEYSAQRRSHPKNPALRKVIAFLQAGGAPDGGLGTVADLGCGKLRHYDLLLERAKKLYLIDTEQQLSRVHTDGVEKYSVRKVTERARELGLAVEAMRIDEFARARLGLDCIFCVAVFDVVTRSTRRELSEAAAQNLAESGVFVVIVPRNDTSITKRCRPENKYLDGHVFTHHGVTTFYRNFENVTSILNDCRKMGLRCTHDMSRYRQVCLLFGKTDGQRRDAPEGGTPGRRSEPRLKKKYLK